MVSPEYDFSLIFDASRSKSGNNEYKVFSDIVDTAAPVSSSIVTHLLFISTCTSNGFEKWLVTWWSAYSSVEVDHCLPSQSKLH